MVKNPPANARDTSDLGLIPGQEDTPEEEMAATLVFLPGKFHGQRSLEGHSLGGRKESDTTENARVRVHTHTRTHTHTHSY